MVKYYGESVIGGRSENQDSIAYTDTKFGFLAVVCDGMGGGKGGKMASQIAIDVIVGDIGNSMSEDPVNAIYNAIQKANFEIFRTGLNDENLKGMGTTVALVLFTDQEALVAHVGDSRVYQIREGNVIHRTYDHSVVFRMLKDGILTSEEQASNHPKSNEITRALGLKPVVDIELNGLAFEKGDLFFLCSDGVNGELAEEEITRLHMGSKMPRDIAIEALRKADHNGVTKGGGHDNASAISIFCEEGSGKKIALNTGIGQPKSKFNPSVVVKGIIGVSLLILLYSITRLKTSNTDYQELVQKSQMEHTKLKKTIDSLNRAIKKIDGETRTSGATQEGNSTVDSTSSSTDTVVPSTTIGDTLTSEN